MALVTDANTLKNKNNNISELSNHEENDLKSETSSTDDGKCSFKDVNPIRFKAPT